MMEMHMQMQLETGAGTEMQMKMETETEVAVAVEMELELKVESLSTSVAEVNLTQKTNVNSVMKSQPPKTALSAIDKIQRFCYIGIFEMPIYVPPHLDLMPEIHFPVVLELCAQVSQRQLIDCLAEVLHFKNAHQLPRRDEALFVLAVYLSSCADENERTLARANFGMLVSSGKDLMIFVKFVKRVQGSMNRKTPFSRTIRKAVIDWYKLQPLERLLELWTQHDFEFSTHRDLLYHIHYKNEKFDVDIMAVLRLIFTSAKDVILWPDKLDPLIDFKTLIMGIAKVRLAEKPEEAIPIIQQLSLGFQHVPRNLMCEPKLVNILLPKMSYDQLVQSWLSFLKVFKVHRSDLRNYIDRFFDESKLREANVNPVRLLLQEARCIKRKRIVSKGTVAVVEPSFMYNVFKRSFGYNKALGLRLHITINLEMCYIGKYLNGAWRSISYLDAVLAFAFGYYKSDSRSNVQIWFDKSGKLKPLSWTPTMTLDEAKVCCQMQKVIKIKQTLTDVIDNAENDIGNTYDVFLVLVPSATRGNPKNNSDDLYRRLNEYRQTRNPNAKFIIISLRKSNGSMSYSKVYKENILELCGISEQMPRIITAFANDKFN